MLVTTVAPIYAQTAGAWLTLTPSGRAAVAVDSKNAATPITSAATQNVSVDVDALFSHAKDEVRELVVNDGKRLQILGKRVIPGQNGARTWFGAVIEEGREYDVFVTELDGHVVGQIKTASTEYELLQTNSGRLATLIDRSKIGATRYVSLARDYVEPTVLGPKNPALEESAERKRRIDEKAKPTPQSTIDLLVVYNTAFDTRHGGAAGVLTRLNNLVAQANVSYDRSDVAITLRLVGTQATTYTNSNDNSVALNQFTPASGSLAGEFANVAAWRDAVGADLVAFIRPFDASTQNGCGIAWLGGFNQTTLSADYGYAVVSEGSNLANDGFFCPDASMAHELGHNMGLMHDRATVLASNGNVLQFGATSYAFGYVIPGSSPTVGDIMSYSDRGVNCFSSSIVFRQGPISGISGGTCGVSPTSGDVLGVSAANTSSSADAAATLNFTRVAVSNFRATAVSTGITISGTITNGASAVSGLTFCTNGAGATCTVTNASTGAYSCSVPSGWSGSIHPRASGARIPAQTFANVTANTLRNISAQSNSSFSTCNLDIDNNGLLEPAIDGVAIMRRLSGVNQTTLPALAGTCAQSSSAAHSFATLNSFNFNATGGVGALPTTDGLLIIRAMNGLGAASITGAVEAGAARTTWSSIQSALNGTCGTNF
jgi:Metallo-peptidase family M12B Reprolysin-like